MFKSDFSKSIVFLIISCVLVFACNYLYSYKDMTGIPYEEIEQYRAQHPHKNITYTIAIEGGERKLKLTQKSDSVSLKNGAQIDSLVSQSVYLQNVQDIDVTQFTVTPEGLLSLSEAFPNAQIAYNTVELLGNIYERDITTLDLSSLRPNQVEQACNGVQVFPHLTSVILSAPGTVSTISLDDAAALYNARPDVTYQYSVELFGQVLSTDMERVEYLMVHIGDEGLEEFRKLLPMMYNLTYFKLDWCDTSNEAMAQLREDYADQFKVVWRIFMGQFNCLTDTIKVWATYTVTNEEAANLKYCNEVKYLDIGHNHGITNVDFLKNMPDLEVAIIAISHYLEDISPISNCTKLEYLEIFSTDIDDLSPLSNLTNLEYLNISFVKAKDLTPLDNLTKLKRLWSTMNTLPKEQIQHFKETHPNCQTYFSDGGSPTGFTWRYMDADRVKKHPRYALLTKQFGYDIWDFSRYPKGYVREDITYESTGITPP